MISTSPSMSRSTIVGVMERPWVLVTPPTNSQRIAPVRPSQATTALQVVFCNHGPADFFRFLRYPHIGVAGQQCDIAIPVQIDGNRAGIQCSLLSTRTRSSDRRSLSPFTGQAASGLPSRLNAMRRLF